MLGNSYSGFLLDDTTILGTFEVANREVVVAQLVERSLLIPEVRGSNPVIGKNLFIY